MKQIIASISLLVICGVNAFGATPCSEAKSKEVIRIAHSKKLSVVACAEAKTGVVSDLTVLKVVPSGSEPLIEGDAAFKSYNIKKSGKNLVIDEAMAASQFRPFIRMTVSCNNDTCTVTESCAWKKTSRKIDLTKLKGEVKKPDPNITGVMLDDAFEAALNGNTSAKDLLLKISANANAEGSEAGETIKADIARLVKVKCL